ncbi:hypothetical protein E2C01_026871 [Portunus trituberculatus]|uniref:Uncharacterized protein n=1 Tax=Portunus trituberculatus TaxID=210409 RepID=A0A5B7EK54_PORTR|nr:hypothetical protein [Portunus trituberculatus]
MAHPIIAILIPALPSLLSPYSRRAWLPLGGGGPRCDARHSLIASRILPETGTISTDLSIESYSLKSLAPSGLGWLIIKVLAGDAAVTTSLE